MIANQKFARLINNDDSRIKQKVLTDTASDLELVVLFKFDKGKYDPLYCVYRQHFHDDNPASKHSTIGSGDLALMSTCDQKEAEEAYEKACEGLVHCANCGAWVPFDEAERFVPAICVCKKEECIAWGRAQEKDFFSYPLD